MGGGVVGGVCAWKIEPESDIERKREKEEEGVRE